MRSPAHSTITEHERSPGCAGVAPADEHIEISWAKCDGRDVVVKAARHPHRSRLRREAEVLQRITESRPDEPCVVEFLELAEGADHSELVTLRHGTVTLGEVGLLSAPERVEALMSLCRVIDRLHDSGWAHGSIDATHVLVDPASESRSVTSGRVGREVRLCSLGEGRELVGRGADALRTEDLQALTALVLSTLEVPGGFGSRRERHRYERAARKAHKTLGNARGLYEGATIAKVLGNTIGAGTSPGGTRLRRPPKAAPTTMPPPQELSPAESPKHSRRWRTWTVGLCIAICFLVGVALSQASRGAGEAPAACIVEVDGEEHGCSAVSVERNIVAIGGRRFELGAPEDSLLVGDWDCNGTGTVVLLEAASGRLFHFGAWSSPSEGVTGDQIGTFEGAIALRSAEGSCGYPDVELADGSTVTPLDRSPGAAAGPGHDADDGT